MPYIIATMWLAIFVFLAVYLGRTPKGRGWRSILWHSRKVRRNTTIALITAAVHDGFYAVPCSDISRINADCGNRSFEAF